MLSSQNSEVFQQLPANGRALAMDLEETGWGASAWGVLLAGSGSHDRLMALGRASVGLRAIRMLEVGHA